MSVVPFVNISLEIGGPRINKQFRIHACRKFAILKLVQIEPRNVLVIRLEQEPHGHPGCGPGSRVRG